MIPDMVRCERVLLNREVVGNFSEKRGDVVFEGDCDDAVLMLSRILGWEEELLELNESARIKKTEDDKEENGKPMEGKNAKKEVEAETTEATGN